MVQYEYKTVEIKDDNFFLDEMDKYGEDGWEAWHMELKTYEQFYDIGTTRVSVTPHYFQKIQFKRLKNNHQ